MTPKKLASGKDFSSPDFRARNVADLLLRCLKYGLNPPR